jgi:hypothetical protein
MTSCYQCDFEGVQRIAQLGAQALIEAAYNEGEIDAKTKKTLEGYAVMAYRPEGFCEKLKARLLDSNHLKEGYITFRASTLD